jgi:hypothetical membrane protein
MAILDKDRLDQRLMTRLLLLCGAIGPLLFMIVFLIEGATRPDYNAWQTTISTLSWGAQGWIQIVNFSLFGLLMLCFAIGLRLVLRTGPGSLWGPILLFIVGLGLITAGPFVTDPVLGYPPGLPSNGPTSLHGMIHNNASLIVFIALPTACFVMGWRFARDPAWRGWAFYSMVTGVLILVFVAWFFASVGAATHAPNGGTAPAGLLERLFSIIGCCWLSLLALRLISKKMPKKE